MRTRFALLGGCLLALVCLAGCAPTVPGRAFLVCASPAPDAVIGALPGKLELHFAQALAADDSTATLIDERGQPVAGNAQVLAYDRRTLEVRLADAGAAGVASGRYTVQWQSVSAATRERASDAFAFTVQPGTPTQPDVMVSPRQSDVDKPISLSGSGFSPDAALTFTIGDDREALGKGRTDANGAFSAAVKVPPDVPFGQQPVWVREESGAQAASQLEVRWGGWPPVRVYTMAEPGPDRGQVKFTVVGRNRSDYVLQTVRVRLDIPDGTSVVSADAGARQDSGALVWDEGTLDRTSLTSHSAVLRSDGPVVGRAHVEFSHRRPRGCVGDDCLPSFVDETYSESGAVTPAQ